MMAELLEQLNDLAAAVRKVRAVNVNAKGVKEAAIAAGTHYFKSCRSDAAKILTDPGELAALDEDWQDLIRLAQGNNAKSSYTKLIVRLLGRVKSLNVAIHVRAPIPPPSSQSTLSHSEAERILIETLDKMIPSASASYQQGLRDLADKHPRLSYRGSACEFREALRETLDLLAPDAEVTKQAWFKQGPDKGGPTMKQKVKYILAARGKTKAQQGVSEKSVELIEGLCGDVTRAVYTTASLSTHIQTTKQEVMQMKRYLDAVLFDILEIGQKT
jgi:hypothetical protein